MPSFAALRAFETTARHLSFTNAAAELGVTQAAVSRQIKSLEQYFKLRLLERNNLGCKLTPAGNELFNGLRRQFDEISKTIQTVSAAGDRKPVVVSVAPFFSSCWLTPRLMRFLKNHPEIDLRLHHSYTPPDYSRDQIDLGINWGDGNWNGVVAEHFMDGSLTPLCAPRYRPNGFSSPLDLIKEPLFFEFAIGDWNDWFKQSLGYVPAFNATRLDDSHALRKIALGGHGVVLFFAELAREDIAIGRLICPFDMRVNTGFHYYLNYPDRRKPDAASKIFMRWLNKERLQDQDAGLGSDAR